LSVYSTKAVDPFSRAFADNAAHGGVAFVVRVVAVVAIVVAMVVAAVVTVTVIVMIM
jgi:hypothetical protein